MENLRLPIALVSVMAVQLTAAVWWVSQQALIIEDLEVTVSQLGSRMVIEDNINLKRDVSENTQALSTAFEELENLWDDLEGMTLHMERIVELQRRVAVIENTLEFLKSRSSNKKSLD